MSSVKENAKKLKDQAKKYGYEIKHTHALELVSQLLENNNRHVTLKKELLKKEENLVPTNIFKLENFEPTLNLPFFKAYVLEFDVSDDEVDFVVTDTLSNAFELIGECSFHLDYLKVLSPQDLNLQLRKHTEDEEETSSKSLMDWILEKQKESGKRFFTVFNDY